MLREQLRRKAKTDLIAFTEWTFPRYRTAEVHRVIAEQLERVERGEIDRLMLCVPPRHGKSELASRRFPAYYLGRHPYNQIISASASGPLADDFGRDVRNCVAGEEYAQVFETRLAPDNQAKGRWSTSQGGSYYAVGIGSDVMGRGAHVLIIDDPFGSMADALSETKRKEVYTWFTGTAYNRLEDKGAIVVIAHRMHEDDLSGMLRAQQAAGGDRWNIVELKALDDDGLALWPEKYDEDALARIRRNIKPRDWSALYQQNPTPDDGTYFKDEWLRPYYSSQWATEQVAGEPARETLHIYGASDYAVTEDGGDYTVHLVVGVDPQQRLWLLDLWRAQANSMDWVEAFCDLVKLWKPLGWAEETGQIKAGVGPFLKRRQRERGAYVVKALFPTKGDKVVRSRSIQGRMEMDGLYVPINAPWYPEFRSELLAFNAGKHDDQVDALGLIGQVLDKMIGGREVVADEPHKIISTDPAVNNVTLADMFKTNERRGRRSFSRGTIK